MSRRRREAMVGEFWAVTCYFNSENDPWRVHNFKVFAERLRKQGVPFLTVELVVDNEDAGNADVKSMSDMYHRVMHPDVLWSKEALINIGIKLLPSECTKVCWIDADILFPFDDDWGQRCSAALDKHKVVQPYERYYFMPEPHTKNKFWDTERPAVNYLPSIAWNYAHGRGTHSIYEAHPGYAWAARRDVLNNIGGLYDTGICMADVLMAYGFIAKSEAEVKSSWEHKPMRDLFGSWGPVMRKHVEEWQLRAMQEIGGDVGVVDGVKAHHLYHGSPLNRKYPEILASYAGFDPSKHARLNENGVLEWTENVPADLKEKVCQYFSFRKRATQRFVRPSQPGTAP
jgi:hypothetical protein